MLNPPTQTLRYNAIHFLEQSPQQRLQILKQLGIARYDFLTKMCLNEANIGYLVDQCQFAEGIGLTKIQCKDLQIRGARFNCSEDDH